MEIMSKVICPYCKEWLDIESFFNHGRPKKRMYLQRVLRV